MLRLITLALVTFVLLFAGIAACGDDDDDTGGDQANGETAVPDPADGDDDDDDDDDGGDDDNVDEGETPSGDLEEYFAAAEVIAVTVDTELDEIGDALDTADPETDEEYIALFQDSYQRGGQALETAWLDMADLTPPSEVEAQHDAFLNSIEGVLSLLSGILEDSQEVTTGDELDELFAEYEPDLTAADTELDDACFALQEAGEANGVSADLRCGD